MIVVFILLRVFARTSWWRKQNIECKKVCHFCVLTSFNKDNNTNSSGKKKKKKKHVMKLSGCLFFENTQNIEVKSRPRSCSVRSRRRIPRSANVSCKSSQPLSVESRTVTLTFESVRSFKSFHIVLFVLPNFQKIKLGICLILTLATCGFNCQA